jgi:hypothetical protein
MVVTQVAYISGEKSTVFQIHHVNNTLQRTQIISLNAQPSTNAETAKDQHQLPTKPAKKTVGL